MKIVLVGRTASGKSTIGDKLEKMGLKLCQSYTDRAKRTENETGHTFLSKEEFNNVMREEKVIAFMQKELYRCCTTEELALKSDVFYLNPEATLQFVRSLNRERIAIIFLDNDGIKRVDKLKDRMKKESGSVDECRIGDILEEDDKLFSQYEDLDYYSYKLSRQGQTYPTLLIQTEYDYTDKRLEELVNSIYALAKTDF